MAHNGHKVAASTVLLVSCKEFLDLIEEYLVMELLETTLSALLRTSTGCPHPHPPETTADPSLWFT